MGSEKNTGIYMSIPIPVAGMTSSPWWESYISSSLTTIDAHDHSVGKGARLSQGSIVVNDTFDFNNEGADSVDFIKFVNPTTYSTTPGVASVYFMNSDFYIKDGSGNIIQLTSGGSLNTSLVGGFTGDYATSGAFAVYNELEDNYKFYDDINYLSTVVAGTIEIRDNNLSKDVYGVKLRTSGNIAATYTWTLPDTSASNASVLNINSNGAISYVAATTYVMTSGPQTINGIKTFGDFPFTPSSAPASNYQVANKKYADDLDLTAVHKTGDETVAGVKTFTSNPVCSDTNTITLDTHLANKKYVDDLDDQNVKLTGSQTVSNTLTLTNLPSCTDTNAPSSNQLVRKQHLGDIIGGLTSSNVGLSNVDNTADSNKAVFSATKLTTARTINSVSFDGTSNVTIPPGALPSTNDGIEYVAKNGIWVSNTGGSFPEVPNDTNTYTRSYNQWDVLTIPTPDVTEAPNDTNQYTRGQEQWNVLNAVPEANIDGKQYARKDAGWVEVEGGGIGGVTTELTASATLVANSVNAVVSTGDKTFVVPTGAPGDTIKVLRNNFGGYNVYTGVFAGSETALVVSDATYSLTLSWLASGNYWIYERT